MTYQVDMELLDKENKVIGGINIHLNAPPCLELNKRKIAVELYQYIVVNHGEVSVVNETPMNHFTSKFVITDTFWILNEKEEEKEMRHTEVLGIRITVNPRLEWN